MSKQQVAPLKACEADRTSPEITENPSWFSESLLPRLHGH